MKTYFKSTGESLFCSEYLFKEALRHMNNPFLVKLNEVIDWESYTGPCLKLYKAKGSLGAPAYRPSLLLKMLFLSYLFNVSEREIERYVNDSISMKAFLGLGIEQAAPDHSSLTIFRDRIIKKGKSELLKMIFQKIITTAQEKGVEFGSVQVIDSTHTDANVNRDKDSRRQKKSGGGGEGQGPRDPEAKYGAKGSKMVADTNGEKVQVTKWIYGYKNHLSVNAKTNMITALLITDGSKYDGHYLKPLLDEDIRLGLKNYGVTTYTADKGYEDGENNAWLNQHRLKDALFYKGMGKIKEAKVKYSLYTTQAEFTEGVKQRYTIERVNGSLKKHGGLGKCRYLGLAKMEFQSYISTMTHNLKTLVRLLYGVYFRAPARA
jgi:IS5 family transposase